MSILHLVFLSDADPSVLVLSSHDPVLVLLSLCIAVFTSGMALQLAGEARDTSSLFARQVIILTGSLALGAGIWAMHFLGMLAFELCATVRFDLGVTLWSMLPSLGASWVALTLLARRDLSGRQLCIGGVLVGAGIGAMHYSGMAAMQMAPLLRYDPWMFALSIVVAVGLAILALWVRFGLQNRLPALWALGISALVMGLAISGMHYVGMAAARFVGVAESPVPMSIMDSGYIATAITLITVTLAVFVVATNALLRYRRLSLQLQASEQHLRSIFDTAFDAILTIDHTGTIRSANRAVTRLFGWHPKQLIGQSMDQLLSPEHAQMLGGHLRDYVQSGLRRLPSSELELTCKGRDGQEQPVRISIGITQNEQRPLFVVFVTDITERKRMERSIRESEQQYRSLISNIPGVSFRCLLDDDWSMIFISDAVQALTGWSAEDFTSRRQSIAALYHPDDYQPAVEQVQAAIEEGRNYTVEYRLLDRQGREHWIWESGSAVCDEVGVPRWIDGVLLDQTETKLRNAEYEGKVNAFSRAMAMVEFDLQGYLLAANENALAILGYSLEQIVGVHHRELCDPHYAASDEYIVFWDDLRAGMFKAGEFLRIGQGGKQFWIQASYNPILDADGKPFKVVKLASDLTPRRLMEQEMRIARDRAEAAAAARSSFLANMSHEIRTPMNAIIGFTELLINTPLSDAQRRHLQTVQHSSRSLLGLLNDILDTAKLDRGAVELEVLDFSLRDLCEQVCTTQRLTAEAKGLKLLLDYPAQVAEFFCGDALRLQQVLTNLVGNAVKFTHAGEVCVRVQGEPDAMRLLIEDTGIGIAADRLEKIFEPFAQADASMSRRFGGTGLGTTISRQLVELMGGRLRVESTLGIGSRFCIELPLRAGKRLAPKSRQVLPQLRALNILAADDVAQNLELLQLTLEQLGHQVTGVVDGQAAVDAFASGHYDLILMDVQMPVVDGLEATRRIRAHEAIHRGDAIPIIALTASVLDHDRQAALDAGMNGFAAKPLVLDALLWEMARLTGQLDEPADVAVVQHQPTDGLFDWGRGAQLWGGPVRMAAAIQRFLDEQSAEVKHLHVLVAAGEWEAARSLVHRLRGTAANLALTHLARLGEALEYALGQAEKPRVQVLLHELSRAFQAVATAVPVLPSTPSGDGPPGPAPADLLAALQRLRLAVARGGLDDQALALLIQSPAHSEAFRKTLERVHHALDDFDFDRALAGLDDLLRQMQDEDIPSP